MIFALLLFVALVLLPGLLHLDIPGHQYFVSAVTIKVVTLWLGPVALSTACTLLAWRYRLSLGWPLVTMLLVCLLGALVGFNVSYDASTPTPTGSLAIGMGFPPPSDQLERGVITLMIALLPIMLAARAKHRSKSIEQA